MKKLEIIIDNLTEAQAIAIEEMFARWISLANVGSSRYVAFFADGDGNFHPKITVNGEKPKRNNLGIDFKEIGGEIKIDFDPIAWKLRELSSPANTSETGIRE